MESRHSILIVDDEAGPREALNMILKPFYRVYNAINGNEALETVRKTPIDLVILDLKMPGFDGTEILREIRKEDTDVEVVILTGYGSLKTAVEAVRLGAADYLFKPFNVTEIISVMSSVLSKKRQRDRVANLLDELGILVGQETPVDQIREKIGNRPGYNQMLRRIFSEASGRQGPEQSVDCLEFVRVLADTLENRDPFTHGHSSRVNYYSNLLAQKLNLSKEEQRDLQLGAYLHDIGKMGVDTRIIYKEGAFTRQELLLMRRHPEIGVDLIKPIGLSLRVVSIIRHHHEFFDGTGYPDGLKGDAIPPLTRIVSASESFDAMVTDRPYRKALPISKIKDELRKFSGKQFDPDLVILLLEIIEEKGENIFPKRFQTPKAPAVHEPAAAGPLI